MTFDTRLIVIALAAFATGGVCASAVVPVLLRRARSGSAATRADALWRLRLLPAGTAFVGMVLVIASFIRFEPREQQESTGIVLFVLAAASVGLVAAAAVRELCVQLKTRRVIRTWMASAERLVLPDVTIPTYAIDSTFPLVVVTGVLRPKLLVARTVLAACSTGQLQAVLAHERRHLVNHDNLRRAIFASLPDVTTWLPIAKRLDAAWHDATEEAADDETARLGADGPLNLAEALIRVAHLVPAGLPAPNLPASALYRGENIERRVNHLLAGPADIAVDRVGLGGGGRGGSARWRLLATATVCMVTGVLALRVIHALVEAAVTFLP